MEGISFHPDYQAAPPNGRPNSPPTTPGSPPATHTSTETLHPTSSNKHVKIPFLEQSPPLEHIEPTGTGYSFNYTRPQPTDISRPSSISSPDHLASDASAADSSPEVEPLMSQTNQPPDQRRIWTVSDGSFDVEELDENDIGYNSQTEVLQPDGFEEASHVRDDYGVSEHFERLNCDESAESSGEAQRRRYERKKKRWSSGLFKRSHSQSIGSDTDTDDIDAVDAHDVGSSARRLRRRVRGPGDRSSLIFEDIGHSHIDEAAEQDESGGGGAKTSTVQQSGEEGLTVLPFWVLQDPMDIDSDSSAPNSSTSRS